ncbi:hypothetical protein [Arthrobacter sp. HY1533]|uniref:hypothetical protein n=1 Tax=Arthrobacter sp. HY1533 TaxID=2970919 RepID=UPI0022BA065B|nr:hypothetical protein [Arthrobacter sp. HY1533]
MTLTLQWVALAVCLGCTAWRIPALAQRRNRGMFWTFAFISICVALSIHAIYMPLDGLLGGRNLTNVFLRLSLFAVFYLLASRVAAAYNSPLARRLIKGPVGLAILIACSLGIWISYFLSDVDGSSTGMASLADQPSIEAYKWFGQAYMAYAAAVVVIPTAKAAFSNRPPLDRAAALLMCIGFAMVCATMPLQLLEDGAIETRVAFASIIFVAAGLALVWVSFMRRPVPPKPRS